MVAGSHSFRSIHPSDYQTCAIDFTNQLYCWGFGIGTVPILMTTSTPVASISVVYDRLCYLDFAGTAWCKGNNGTGALGNGTVINSSTFVQVLGGHTFFDIVGGSYFHCALKKNGEAYCWGSLYEGVYLGGGNPVGSTTPVPVSGGLRFSKLSAKSHFTCGRTIAGDDFCWGKNSYGQLGDLTTEDRNVPTAVEGASKIIDIFASPYGFGVSIH